MERSRVRITGGAGPQPEADEGRGPEARPFRILVLGDFGLRGSGPGLKRPPGAQIDVREVDADTYLEVLRRWTPSLELPGAVRLEPREMDDFHPDSLAERWGGLSAGDTPTAKEEGVEPSQGGGGGLSLLEQMLGERLPAPPAPPGAERTEDSQIAEFIRGIGRAYAERRPSASEVAAGERARQARAEWAAEVLRFAPFLEAEALWRSVFFLLERLEPGGDLRLFLGDLGAAEWAEDLAGARNLRETAFYRAVVGETVETYGETPWALVAGLFDMPVDARGLIALSRAGRICAAGGTALVLGGSAEAMALSGDGRGDRLAEAWRVLRNSQEAASLGLVYPRLALRMGYGAAGLSAEVFEATEVEAAPLWGSGALAVIAAVGAAFRDFGWGMQAGARLDLRGMAAGAGQAPVERVLTEPEAEAALEAGVMPLVWWKGSDRVRLVRVQSIEDPPGRLKGAWEAG